MAEDRVKTVYDNLVSAGYKFKDEQHFRDIVADSTRRRKLYDRLSQDYDLADFDTFSNDLGVSQSQASSVAKKDETLTGNAEPKNAVLPSGEAEGTVVGNDASDGGLTPDSLVKNGGFGADDTMQNGGLAPDSLMPKNDSIAPKQETIAPEKKNVVSTKVDGRWQLSGKEVSVKPEETAQVSGENASVAEEKTTPLTNEQMMSGIQQASKELNATTNSVESVADAIIKERTEKPAESFQRNLEEEQKAKMNNVVVQHRLDKSLGIVDAISEYKKGVEDELTKVAMSGGGQAVEGMRNNAMAPDVMSEKVAEGIIDSMTPEDLADLSYKSGISAENMAEYITQSVQDKVYGAAYNAAKPKTDAEYALMNTVMKSLIGKITIGAKAGRVQNEIMRAAAQDYNAGIGTRLATGAATILLDMPAFALPGKAAGAIAGGTGRFSRALVESSLKKKMHNGAITFGGYDLMSEIVDQAQNGEVDILGGALNVAKGAILGATVGGLSYGTRAVTDAMKGGYKYLRPAVNALGLGAEAAVFTGAGELEKAANGQFNRDEVIGDYLENLGTFGILRLAGYAGNVMSMGAKNTFDYLKQNGELPKGVKFSKEEKSIIEDYYGRKYDDILTEMGNANAADPNSYLPYLSFVYNMDIPFAARQKVISLFEGKPITPLETYAKQEGKRVVTYDVEGGMLDAKDFASEEEATKFYNKTKQDAERNFVQQNESSLANMLLAKNNSTFIENACTVAGINEQQAHIAVEKMRNNEPLSPQESTFINELTSSINEVTKIININEALKITQEEAKRISDALGKDVDSRTAEEQGLVDGYIARLNSVKEELYLESNEAKAERVMKKAWQEAQSEEGRKKAKAKDIYDDSVNEGEDAGNEAYESNDVKALPFIAEERDKAAASMEAVTGKAENEITEEDIANVLMNGNEEQQSAAAAFARTNTTMETIANRVNTEISKAQEETERIWQDRVNAQGEVVEATLSDGRKGWIRNKGSNGNVFFVDESGKVTPVPEAMVSSSNVLGKLSDVVASENERIANEITADYDRRFSGVGELGAGQTYDIVLPNGDKQTITIQGQDSANGGWIVAYNDGEVETIGENELIAYIGEARRAGYVEEAKKAQPMQMNAAEGGGNAPSIEANKPIGSTPSTLEGARGNMEQPSDEQQNMSLLEEDMPYVADAKAIVDREIANGKNTIDDFNSIRSAIMRELRIGYNKATRLLSNYGSAGLSADTETPTQVPIEEKTETASASASTFSAQPMTDEDAEIDAQPLTREEGIALSILERQNEDSLHELNKAYKKDDADEIKRLTNLINAGMPNGVRVVYDETTKSAGLAMRRSQYDPSSQLMKSVDKHKAGIEKMNEILLRTNGKSPTLEDAQNEEEMDAIMYFSDSKRASRLIKDEYERLQKMRLQSDLAGDVSVEDRIAAVEELAKKYWKHNLGTVVAMNGYKERYMTGEDALEQYLAEGYDEVKEILNDNEPKNLREYVTKEILGAVFNAEDLKKQITGSKNDFRWLGKHVRTNGGETIEGVAHKICENLPNTYKSEPHDDSIIRDIIIDVLSSYDNMSSLRNDALNPQISRTRDAFDAIKAQEQREFEQVFYDKYHLSVGEARDYLDAWTESVKDLENTPEELYESEINSNIAEKIIENGRVRESNNQSDSAEGNAPTERPGDIQERVPEDTSVLPREQVSNEQRTKVSDGRNPVEEGRSEEDDSAVPNGPVSNEEERSAVPAASDESTRREQVTEPNLFGNEESTPSGEAEVTEAEKIVPADRRNPSDPKWNYRVITNQDGSVEVQRFDTSGPFPINDGFYGISARNKEELDKIVKNNKLDYLYGLLGIDEDIKQPQPTERERKNKAISEKITSEVNEEISKKRAKINENKKEIEKKRKEVDERNGIFGDTKRTDPDMFDDESDFSKENFDNSTKDLVTENKRLEIEIDDLNKTKERNIAQAIAEDKAQKDLFTDKINENGELEQGSAAENGAMGERQREEVGRPEPRRMVEGDTADNESDTLRSGRVSGETSSGADNAADDALNNNQNNFHLTKEEYDQDSERTPAKRYRDNVDAIKLLHQLDEDNRRPTADEMRTLSKFSGWGGLGSYFNDNKYSKELRELLSDEEYEAAELNINSGYYTPYEICEDLWKVAEKLGFKGGSILEGSAGTGNILSVIPEKINKRSDITAVEKDAVTGKILSYLYPDADTHISGFEELDIPNGSVDLSITNVPFVSGLRVYDSQNTDLSRKFENLHDFCIAKNVRKLRDGGLGIFLTSSGTLDKSKKLRTWLIGEGNADVIGAFRLNNETFSGTNVTSDIVVIRKRVDGKPYDKAIDVQDCITTDIKEYYDATTNKDRKVAIDYNKYFVEHPEYTGGKIMAAFEAGDYYRPGSIGCYPIEGENVQNDRLKTWVDSFKDGGLAVKKEIKKKNENDGYEHVEGHKEGQMSVNKKGEVCINRNGSLIPITNNNKVKGHQRSEVVRDYVSIKTALDELLDYQANNDSDEGLKPLQDKLNTTFDTFKKKYGNFHKDNRAISFLKDDVDFASVAALETYTDEETIDGKKSVKEKKADVFTKRVLQVAPEPKPKTIRDGVIVSLSKFDKIDITKIAEMLGKTASEAKSDILKEGLGFENPLSGEVEVSYKYLSGNVREKLTIAKNNNKGNKYSSNIEALEKALPLTIPSHLIDFSLGSSWIPNRIYSEFIENEYGLPDRRIEHAGGVWSYEPEKYVFGKNREKGVHSELLGKYIGGDKLFQYAINNQVPKISKTEKDWDGTTHTVVDKEATNACLTRVDEIKSEFVDWLKDRMRNEPKLADELETIYNENFNSVVPMEIGEEFLSSHLEGANPNISLYPHQSKAVIKALNAPILLVHQVGTGKTFTLISSAMEMRRLGNAKKPMIVVQNATTGQFVTSARELYPNAKILTCSEKDMTKEGRSAFYAKIKYNDWDMIIIPQSVFEMIPDSDSRKRQFIQEKIDEKMAAIEIAKRSKMDSRTVSQMERELQKLQEDFADANISGGKNTKKDAKKEAKAKENAAARAEEQLDRATDDVSDFDEMGIDALLIDEAHAYKHLGFATTIQRGVKGVDPSFSKRSASLYLKTRSVFDNVGFYRNVVFATGTPISNTAAEIWTFMKYLMPSDEMKQNGIYNFDDFVHNFGKINQSLEFTTSGKFKETTRFSSYWNLPELVRIWGSVADTVLTKDQEAITKKLPKLENSKVTMVYLPQSDSVVHIMRSVKSTLEAFEKMDGAEKKANSYIPLVMYGVAKRAAIDTRLVLPANKAIDEPSSKTNKSVENILKDLNDSKAYNGTVALFCDSYRRVEDGKETFNIYEDIKKKLVANGIPEEQISIIRSDMKQAAKEKIFAAVNAGEIRVIMGSTQTLGTGVNIQERLFALHNLDVPDRPMDMTQRIGRGMRQGNRHADWGIPIRIYNYGVEDTLDVTGYQRLDTKSKFIDSVMNGAPLIANNQENRTIEEEEEGLYENPVAMLSGSEFALKKNQAERELRKYKSKKQQWEQDQKYIYNKQIENARIIENNKKRIADAKGEQLLIDIHFPDGKVKEATVNSKPLSMDKSSLDEFFKSCNKAILELMERGRKEPRFTNASIKYAFTFNGMRVEAEAITRREDRWNPHTRNTETVMSRELVYKLPDVHNDVLEYNHYVPGGYMKDLFEYLNNEVFNGKRSADTIKKQEEGIAFLEKENERMKAREGVAFQDEDKLAEAEKLVAEYTAKMKEEMDAKEKKYANIESTDADNVDFTSESEQDDDDNPDGGGGGGSYAMYDDDNDYEVDKSNPAYAKFAELNKRWSDMVLDVSKREISDDEKISIIDDAVEGMVNEMLDEYKTVDYSVISKRNFEEVMRKNGCKKDDIEEAKDMIAEGAKGIYSSVANKLFVVSSNISNFAKFFEAYDHERQHQWNRSHSWYVLKMKDIFNKDLDKARSTLAKISGTNKYDSLDNIGDIADEIIAHGITKSNLRGFEGKHLEGADEDVVKLLKDIYYEQTNDADLSKSRFLKRVVRGDGGGTSAVQQNVFGESGTLEEQGSKPSERGKEATWKEIRAERIKPFVKDGRVTLTEDNVANYLYNVAGKLQHNIFDKTSKFLKESIDKESGERYFEINREKAKVLLPEIDKELNEYRIELFRLLFGVNARVSDAARSMLENEVYRIDDAEDYYRRIAYGNLDWRTAERPKFLLDGEKVDSPTKKAVDEANRIKAEMQDDEYLAAVERGDTETAQAMVNAKANQMLDDFSRLQDDANEVGFKYHRGEAPKKVRTMYAVFNVFPDGFKAAYAGNKNATPVGVWLDAQNLKSYKSSNIFFDDGTPAEYIPGGTGKSAKSSGIDINEVPEEERKNLRLLLKRGGKHGSDVPNFSQMNLKQDENGNKVSSPNDGALPHNKLVFEIECGMDEQGDLTDFVKENGRMMKGKNQGLAEVQPNKFYFFKTNPNAKGNWGIAGTFRIKRLVPHDEIVSVSEKAGVPVQKWVGGYHPEDFGLSVESVNEMYENGKKQKLMDAVTYDDNGNVIPLSERFSEKEDLRFLLGDEGETWIEDEEGRMVNIHTGEIYEDTNETPSDAPTFEPSGKAEITTTFEKPVRAAGEGKAAYSKRLKEWQDFVDENITLSSMPVRDMNETFEDFNKRMDEWRKANVLHFKKEKELTEASLQSMLENGIKVAGEAEGDYEASTTLADKDYIGREELDDMRKKAAKHSIRDMAVEYVNHKQAANFEDSLFINDIRQHLTKKERQQMMFILEGDWNFEDNPVRDEVLEYASMISDWYDNIYEAMGDADALFGAGRRDNYVTHMWDKNGSNPEAWNTFIKGKYKTIRSRYTRERSIPTYAEGIKAGLKPKYDDICDIMTEYGRLATQSIENMRFIDFLKTFKVNGKRVLIKHGTGENGYTHINSNALEDYDVLDDVKKQVSAVLGSVPAPEGIMKGYDIWSNLSKKMKLSLSFFHHLALTESAVSTMGPKALKVLAKNIIWDTMADAAKKTKSGIGNGNAFERFYQNLTSPALRNPDLTREAVRHLVQLGVASDYDAHQANSIFTATTKWLREQAEREDANKIVAGGEKALSVLTNIMSGAAKGMDTMLWTYLHDTYKLYAFDKMSREVYEAYDKGEIDELTKDMRLDEVGQFVNDNFGGQNWEVLGMSPKQLQIARRLLLSVDWTTSSVIRQPFAFTGAGNVHDKSYGGKKIRAKNGSLVWLRFGSLLIFGNLLNAAFRKKDEDKEKKKAEETGEPNRYELLYPEGMTWKDYTGLGNSNGKRSYIYIGRYDDGREKYLRDLKQAREVFEFFTSDGDISFPNAALNKIYGKQNPVLQVVEESLFGTNFTGWDNEEINGGNWRRIKETAKLAGSTLLPMSVNKDKEFDFIDLFAPTSRGYNSYRATQDFKKCLTKYKGDEKMLEKVYRDCLMNNIDAEAALKRAASQIKSEEKKMVKMGATSLEEAMDKFDESEGTKRTAYEDAVDYFLDANEKKVSNDDTFDNFMKNVYDVDGNDIKVYDSLKTSLDLKADYEFRTLRNKAKEAHEYEKKYVVTTEEKKAYFGSEEEGLTEEQKQHRFLNEMYTQGNKANNLINEQKGHLSEEGADKEKLMEHIRKVRANYINNFKN